MIINFDDVNFKAFQTCKGKVCDPKSSKIPRIWAACTGLGNALPDGRVNREDLFGLVSCSGSTIEALCWSILAWGGMHGGHRNALNAQSDKSWLKVASDIRAGTFNRSCAYKAFQDLKLAGKLTGMGPAYYTKLIFFLMPRTGGCNPGYIMDQWVGCSINLLASSRVVLMDYSLMWKRFKGGVRQEASFVVSDLNDEKHYEAYCCHIEEVAKRIGRKPDDTELLLMSEGGRIKQQWREYVIQNRQVPS